MISNRHLLAALALIGVTALAVLTGCSDTRSITALPAIIDSGDYTQPLPAFEDDDFDRGASRRSEKMIKPDKGGKVKLNWFTVVIPPGALDEKTRISITRDDPKSATVELEPDGIEFNCEVILQINLKRCRRFMKRNRLEATDLKIALFVENSGDWVALETFHDEDKDIVWAVTNHFSRYALAD
jgi:hypothetical protein